MRDELKQVYNGVKEFFIESTDNLKQAKSLLGGVVEKVTEKVQGSTFEHIFKKRSGKGMSEMTLVINLIS